MRLGLAAADATAPYQVPIATDGEHRLEDRAKVGATARPLRGTGFGLTGRRAIRVPHRTVKSGTERTATVTVTRSMNWPSLARPA
jgi:hypothetical protein